MIRHSTSHGCGGVEFFSAENIEVLILAAAPALAWGVFFKLKTQ